MSLLTEKVKDQLNQINSSVAQVTKAGRGLVVVVSEEGKKQLADLIKTGEAQQSQGIQWLEQIKGALPANLDDAKSSAKTFGLAARGLLNKAKVESERLFNELVALGDTTEKPAARKTAVRKAA